MTVSFDQCRNEDLELLGRGGEQAKTWFDNVDGVATSRVQTATAFKQPVERFPQQPEPHPRCHTRLQQKLTVARLGAGVADIEY